MRFTVKTFLFFMLLLGISCNSTSQQENIQVLDAVTFKVKSEQHLVVDVRTPEEFKEGHIKNAVNINFKDASFLEEINKLDKSKPVFLYCRSGRRSSNSAKKMADMGFEEIYDLKGGIINWIDKKFETVK